MATAAVHVIDEGRVTIPATSKFGIMRAIAELEAEPAEHEQPAEDDITY